MTLPRLLRAAVLLLLLAPGVRAPGAAVALTNPPSTVCWTSDGAQYSLSAGGITPVRGEFAFTPKGQQPFVPRVFSEASAEQGDVVRIYLGAQETVSSVSLELRSSGGRVVTRSAGFRVDRPGDTPIWCVLFGIPAAATVGTDELSVTALSGDRRWLLVQDFVVLPHDFLTERIALTTAMTQLLTVPDPRKTEQSSILARILVTPHPGTILQTGPLAVPFPAARRTSGYGDTREYDYTDGGSEVSTHYGVDMAVPTGTPVPAAGRGRVVFAGFRILTGNTVIVEHLPGLFTLYYHMSSLAVKEGAAVDTGTIIGAVGMTGFATGPHLHWEVELNGVAVDPDRLVTAPLLDTNPALPDIHILTSDEGR